jgi:hypothetical protein
MAIRKNSSRFTDRNKIRRMFAEGYSLHQIEETVSITQEHINYVLNEWDADEELWKDREKARVAEEAEAARTAMVPENAPALKQDEIERIKEAARREVLDELERQTAERSEKITQSITEELVEDEEPAEDDPAPVERTTPSTRKRRRKAAA